MKNQITYRQLLESVRSGKIAPSFTLRSPNPYLIANKDQHTNWYVLKYAEWHPANEFAHLEVYDEKTLADRLKPKICKAPVRPDAVLSAVDYRQQLTSISAQLILEKFDDRDAQIIREANAHDAYRRDPQRIVEAQRAAKMRKIIGGRRITNSVIAEVHEAMK